MTARVRDALGPNGKVSDLLDPFEAFVRDLRSLVDTAERCGLLPAALARTLRAVVSTIEELISELRDALPEDAIQLALDIIQSILGILGLNPLFGEPADAIDTAISAARQDWLGAGLGLLCLIPVAGIASGLVAILFMKGPRIVEGINNLSKSKRLLELLRKLLKSISNYCPSFLKGPFDDLVKQIDDILASGSRTLLQELQKTFEELVEAQLLPRLREVDPNLKWGYTGSFSTGVVGNKKQADVRESNRSIQIRYRHVSAERRAIPGEG